MANISVVGIVGVPPQYGGFETLVDQLLKNNAQSHSYEVYCTSLGSAQRRFRYQGARLRHIPLPANGILSTIYDFVALLRSMRSDIILVLGVSGGIFLPLFRLLCRGKLVVNVDGLEWRRAKWSSAARVFLKLSEWLAVKSADAVIADNTAIRNYLKREYSKLAFEIAYGGDHVSACDPSSEDLNQFPQLNSDYALTVCRIEPENNLEMILQGMVISGVPYLAIGNWDHSAYGRRLRSEFSRYSNIVLLDPIYDQIRLDGLRAKARWYIHGHSAGGTNPSLVEAMQLGRCILCFDVEYNRFTTVNCGRYFGTSAELAKQLLELRGELADEIGLRMMKIAQERYQWRLVEAAYAGVFEHVLTGGAQ